MQFGFRRLAAATVVLTAASRSPFHISASADVHTSGIDCRTVTGARASTGTPWPSPPFTPYEQRDLCNDTGQAVNDLHVAS